MKKTTLIGIVVLLIAVVGLAVYMTFVPPPSMSEPSSSVSNIEDSAVRKVVEGFGTKLQMVSLLAPTASRKAAMEQNYGAYVAPELLAKWYPEGADALGRSTSSPWPEKIDIVSVTQKGKTMVVEGNVIEVATATESQNATAPVAVYPVSLTLEKRGEAWLITKAVKGAYSELPHTQTIVGFWECLPHKNTSGPQTTECAFGIAADQSDGHYAIDTSLMSTYPVDYPTGTKLRVTGVVTLANQLSSIQKYNIDGIIRATSIEKI